MRSKRDWDIYGDGGHTPPPKMYIHASLHNSLTLSAATANLGMTVAIARYPRLTSMPMYQMPFPTRSLSHAIHPPKLPNLSICNTQVVGSRHQPIRTVDHLSQALGTVAVADRIAIRIWPDVHELPDPTARKSKILCAKSLLGGPAAHSPHRCDVFG